MPLPPPPCAVNGSISRTLMSLYRSPLVPTLVLRQYTVMLGLPDSLPSRLSSLVRRRAGFIPDLQATAPTPKLEPVSSIELTFCQFPPLAPPDRSSQVSFIT